MKKVVGSFFGPFFGSGTELRGLMKKVVGSFFGSKVVR
jgi:hypothetical protein